MTKDPGYEIGNPAVFDDFGIVVNESKANVNNGIFGVFIVQLQGCSTHLISVSFFFEILYPRLQFILSN